MVDARAAFFPTEKKSLCSPIANKNRRLEKRQVPVVLKS